MAQNGRQTKPQMLVRSRLTIYTDSVFQTTLYPKYAKWQFEMVEGAENIYKKLHSLNADVHRGNQVCFISQNTARSSWPLTTNVSKTTMHYIIHNILKVT